jgi:hypothetical protein
VQSSDESVGALYVPHHTQVGTVHGCFRLAYVIALILCAQLGKRKDNTPQNTIWQVMSAVR